MAYIGREPQVGNFQVCDAISVVNGQAAYTMQVSSVNVSPETANHMIVSLNGIIQTPGTSYTVAGSTITFASNLATGDVINFIHILGSVLDLGVPSNDTVGAAQIKDDLISGTTALASEPADTDEFLVSDAGTLKRIDYSLIKGAGISVAGQWRHTSNFTGGGDITSNWEENDTTYSRIGSAMSESSGVFTFPSTGIYLVRYNQSFSLSGDSAYNQVEIKLTTDNSSYDTIGVSGQGITQASSTTTHAFASSEVMIDISNVSTHKVKFGLNIANSSTNVRGSSTANADNSVTFIRLGDT